MSAPMHFSVPAGNALVFSTTDGDLLEVPHLTPLTRSITHGIPPDPNGL